MTDVGTTKYRVVLDTLGLEQSAKRAQASMDRLEAKVKELGTTGEKITGPALIALRNRIEELRKKGAEVPEMLQGFRSGLDSLKSSLTDAASVLGKTFAPMAAVAGGIAAIGGVALVAGKQLLDLGAMAGAYGSELVALSARTGMTVEGLQELRESAALSDISFESVTRSAVMMEAALAKAPQKFEAIGLSVDALKGMSADQALLKTVDAINQLGTQAERVAKAREIFGKAGAELLQLGKYAEGTAKQLGMVWTDEQAKDADAFDDQLGQLGRTWQGLWRNIGLGIASNPDAVNGLQQLTEAVGAFSKEVLAQVPETTAKMSELYNVMAMYASLASGDVGRASGFFSAAREADKKRATAEQTRSIVAMVARDAANLESMATPAGMLKWDKLGRDKYAAAGWGALGDVTGPTAVERAADEKREAAWKKESAAAEKIAEEERKRAEKLRIDMALGKLNPYEGFGGQTWQLTMPEAPTVSALDQAKGTAEWEAIKDNIQELIPLATKYGMSVSEFSAKYRKSGEEGHAFAERMKTEGKAAVSEFGAAVKHLPDTILKALQGGGDVGKSIGASLGAGIATDLSASLGKHLGKTLGGVLGSVMPGLGSLLGSGLGSLLDSTVGKLFGGEGKKVNDMRDAFFAQFGDSWDDLNEKALSVGMDLRELYKADTVKEYEAAVRSLTDAFAAQDEANQDIADAMEKYGLTSADMGSKWQAQEVEKQGQALYKQYQLLIMAGASQDTVLQKMSGDWNAYVESALAAGVQIPEAMRNAVTGLAEMGSLTSDLGQVQWTDKLSAGLDNVVTQLQRIADAWLGIAPAANQAGAAMGAATGGAYAGATVATDYQYTQAQMPSAASGGYWDRPTPVMVGHGPEVVSPIPMMVDAVRQGIAQAGGFRGGGGPIVVQVMLDRRVVAEAVADDIASDRWGTGKRLGTGLVNQGAL